MVHSDRPEHSAPPDVFYNDTEARKYTTSTRIMQIQAQLTERAIELLALPQDNQPKLLLDLGCGSGLSGETLTEQGHYWTGFDISPSMLEIAKGTLLNQRPAPAADRRRKRGTERERCLPALPRPHRLWHRR